MDSSANALAPAAAPAAAARPAKRTRLHPDVVYASDASADSQADETASPAAALTPSPRLPTISLNAASAAAAAAKSPAAAALKAPLTVDTEAAAPPSSAPGAQCSPAAAAPAAAAVVTAVALCKADKPPPSPAAETASESDAADSDDDDDYDDDEDAEEALLRGSGYHSDGSSSGGDGVSVLVPTTPGGRPFSSAFAMWADHQRRLGRDPRALLRVVCEDMDLEVDVDGMLAGGDDEGCGDGGDDDDDGGGARPRRADTGGKDLNDVDNDVDGNDSGTRGADALTDSGRAVGRGGSTFAARTNARAWRILQSLMMWRNKCLVAEKRVTRPKLTSINTLEDVAALLTRARNVIVLTGAGISVACGIPDFRSENGLYSMLGEYQLPSPQAMFDIAYFRTNPAPFFKFARELLPGSYTPSATHRFIKALQDRGKLLRNYTQNIDGLEREAGVLPEHLHQCHGSLDTARCLCCEHRVPLSDIEAEIRAQTIPMCKICNHPDGVVKPDIVFFGEPLGRRFMDLLTADRARCDAVLVMGSSLKVAPVNLIIGWMPRDVPLVLLNRETVGQPHAFDVELLGDCDAAVAALTRLLGWPADAGGGGGGAMAAEAEAAPPQPEFEPPSTYYFANGKRKADALGGGGGALSAEALLDLDAAAASYESTMERATRIHSPAHTDSPASSPLSHGGSSSIGGGGNAAAARRAGSVGGSAGADAAGRSAHF